MIIRHKRFLDVCFQTTSETFQEYGHYLGRWVNMGYTKSWYLPTSPQWIQIRNKQNWEKCTDSKVDCLRYTTWELL